MVDKGEGQAPQHHRALQATLQSPHDYPNDHFRPILIWWVDVFGSQYFVDSVSPAQADFILLTFLQSPEPPQEGECNPFLSQTFLVLQTTV